MVSTISREECLADLSKQRRLTSEELIKVKKERLFELGRIRGSLPHFLKYVKIQEPGSLAVSYELWPHLVDFHTQIEANDLIDLVKSKKIGISWGLAVRALWEIYNKVGWNVLEFSKGQGEAQELLSKSKIIYENLPRWMKIYTLEPNSTERFGFKEMGSKITAYPSTETAGVGETAGLVIHDEADFHDFFEVNLSHTRATVADTLGGKLIIVSTVDKTKPNSYFKEHWKRGEGSGYPGEGQNGFKALFYGVFARPGRDEAFFQAMVRENEATPWVVEANYPRTAQEALSPLSAQSCFKKERLDRLWDNAIGEFFPSPGEPEVRQGFIYILYPPRVGTQYVAGVDVGEGVGLDYSCLTIVGKEGLNAEVSAVIYSNTVGTDAFAFEVDRLCRDYHSPLLVVDNIGIGRAVIDKLQQLGYPNLYYPDLERKKKAGWSLTRANKRELLVKLVELINNGSLITKWKPQVKELMEYQWVNAYPEPTGKTHGDTVIPLELICAVWDKIGPTEKAKLFVKGVQVW